MKKGDKLFYGWIIVLGGVLIGAATNLLNSIANVVIGLVSEDFSVPRTMFNLATVISMPVVMVLSPVAGRYFRTNPKKKIMIAGSVVFGLALFACSLAPNIYWFYVLIPLAGATTAFVNNVPVSTIINNWFVEKKGLAIGIAGAGVPLASMVTTPIISWLVDTVGWRQAYAYVGICAMILLLLVCVFIIQFRPEDKGLLPLGYKAGGEAEATVKKTVVRRGVMIGDAKKFPMFYLFLLSMLLIGIAASGTSSNQYVYLTDSGYSAAYASLVVSISSGVGILGRIFLGHLFDKKGVKFTTVYAMGVLAVAEISLLLIKLPISPLVLAVSYGLGGAVNQIPRSILPEKYFGDVDYGSFLGMATSLQMCGIAAGPMVASAFFDITGSYVPAWYLFLVLIVLTGIIWLYCDQAKKKIWERYEKTEG